MKVAHQMGCGWIVVCALASVARPQTQVVAWGLNDVGQCNVPALPPGRVCVEVAAGYTFSLARFDDGSIVAWGNDTEPPALPSGLTYVKMSAEYYLAAALRSDGSLVAWGGNVPDLPADPSYVQIAVGFFHVLAIRIDGSIGAWGDNQYGQIQVPTLPVGLTALKVDGGIGHSAALLSDGSVIAWGRNLEGQCDVPPLPTGMTYVDLSANGYVTAARRSDGSIVVWGTNAFSQLQVPTLPPGLVYVGLSAGTHHVLARRSDGSVVAWGVNNQGQCNVPPLASGASYVEIAGGWGHSLAVRDDGLSCGAIESYCVSTPNSSGQSAKITAWGSLALPDNDTRLWAGGCPPHHLGLFFYGEDPTQIPLGNGSLCISPFYKGLFRLDPVVQVNAGGEASFLLDFAALLPAGQITAGSTWNFQFWFRDPEAGGGGTNLTDAVRVTFCP